MGDPISAVIQFLKARAQSDVARVSGDFSGPNSIGSQIGGLANMGGDDLGNKDKSSASAMPLQAGGFGGQAHTGPFQSGGYPNPGAPDASGNLFSPPSLNVPGIPGSTSPTPGQFGPQGPPPTAPLAGLSAYPVPFQAQSFGAPDFLKMLRGMR